MDDVISRQAALDCVTYDVEYTTERIKALPSLQPTCNQLATDCISRQAAIDALRVAYWDDNIQSAKDDPCIVDAMTDWAIRQVKALPSVQQEHKWETCFDCPLSHGCPKIKGCTNEQAIEYASQIPNNCPLSAQPEIIRCKDCKHLKKNKFTYRYECGKGVVMDPLPDGSCNHAEMRTDGVAVMEENNG